MRMLGEENVNCGAENGNEEGEEEDEEEMF